MRDYYEILGVQKNADTNTIKKAYRKVAMKYHPDKNPGDSSAEEKFKEAAEAYSILNDSDKRQRYDQFGHAGVNQNASSGFQDMDINDIFSSFGDIFGGGGGFGDIFGGGQTRRRQADHLKISLSLTLEEIYNGSNKTVKIKRLERTGKEPVKCNVCNGTGEVRRVQRSFLGQVVNVQKCMNCNGLGYIGGLEKKSATIKVKVPSGVSNGNYIPLKGEGNQAVAGIADGDLIVYFEEKEHELFTRHENDIFLDSWIEYPLAVFGGSIEVPTLSGKVNLKIPAGIKSGQILRLKGKGLPEVNSRQNGDELVKINIKTPTKYNKKVRKLLQTLNEELGEKADFIKFK